MNPEEMLKNKIDIALAAKLHLAGGFVEVSFRDGDNGSHSSKWDNYSYNGDFYIVEVRSSARLAGPDGVKPGVDALIPKGLPESDDWINLCHLLGDKIADKLQEIILLSHKTTVV